MGWFGKLAFGSLGMFIGGPLGAIAGAALGHHLVDKKEAFTNRRVHTKQEPRLEHAEQTQAAYFISLFSILGKLSKIDGVVARDEIAVVQDFINNLPMADREKQFAKQVFNEAKSSRYAIEDFATQLYQSAKHQPTVLLSFFNLLFQVAAADGTFHPAEEAALKRIKDIFQISDQEFDNIKAVFFNQLDKYYKMLDCTPESANQEIKSSYKKLVKDFHPDRIVSKGLPEEFIDFATKRFREIQEAYEKIRQERNF
jgi:DnaJ like chaperone protein